MTPTDKPTPARPVRIGGLMRCCLDRPRAVSREGPPMTDDKADPGSLAAVPTQADCRASPSAEPPYESEHDIGEQLSLDTQCVHNFALTRWDCLRCTVAAAERAAASKARAEVERLREERDATKASAEAWEWTTRRNADAADALRTQLEEARELLRDFRDNHDCDEDAHRYRNEDTQCRCCMAAAFLAAYPAEPPAPEACSHGISFAVDCPACTAIYYNTPAPEEPR